METDRISIFKKKHYLTGIDWIIHSLDDLLKRQSGNGNVCQIVLKLQGRPDPLHLKTALSEFTAHFPVVNGTPARAWNLAPYWKIPQDSARYPVLFRTVDVTVHDTSHALQKVLEEMANQPFPNKWTHLAFCLITTPADAYFAMTFDHRLFDGRGAEAFMDLFRQYCENKAMPLPALPVPEPHHLDHWKEKFLAGRQVNRHLLALGKGGPPCVMPTSGIVAENGFRFHTISFSRDQTENITAQAYQKVGYLMLMPFLTVASVRALHPIFREQSENPDADYVIPINIDTRSSEARQDAIFFNRVSFLFVRIPAKTAESFTELVAAVKSQVFERMKAKLPQDIQTASFLMRIVPLPILHYLVGFHMGGHLASFCFSFLGDGGFQADTFAGHEVKDLFHMPKVPIPSGLGIFFHQFQGRLKVYISYADGLLSREDLEMISLSSDRSSGGKMRLADRSCDVLVVGGGVAGVCAAVSSARLGADTLLVEENRFPGGSAIISMHRYICGLYALDGDSPTQPDHTQNDGLVREVCHHLFQRSPNLLPEKMGRVHLLPFQTDQLISTFHYLLNRETHLKSVFGCRVTAVETHNQKTSSVQVAESEKGHVLRPTAVVDCSGDAVVSQLSGADQVKDAPHMGQMAGFSVRIANLKDPDEMISLKVPYILNRAAIDGVMPLHVRFTTLTLNKDRTEAVLKFAVPNEGSTNEIASVRKVAEKTHCYLATQISAFAKSTIVEMSSWVSHREGPRMMGKYLLTAEDLLSGRKFLNSTVQNSWPIEFWHPEKGPIYRYPERCYDIPEECQCSSSLMNLFSGGRCISVTPEALGSTRVMGTCMALGEQAGRLAAEFAKGL